MKSMISWPIYITYTERDNMKFAPALKTISHGNDTLVLYIHGRKYGEYPLNTQTYQLNMALNDAIEYGYDGITIISDKNQLTNLIADQLFT